MIASLIEQKSLPHSEESERAVLAAILLDPTRHLPTTSGRLRPEDFYLERHQRLYQAMLELQNAKVEIDLRTVQAHLEQQKLLQEVGGLAYIATLEVDLPDLGRVEHYVEIVKERSLRRRLIAASADIYRNCQDGGLEAKQALDRAEQAILELAEQATPRGFVTLGDAIKGTVFDLEERPDEVMTGLKSGFDDWDALTYGLNPGNLIIIAGRPGMGKCLSGEAEIVEADGGISTIEQIVRRQSARLLTLGPNDRFEWTAPSAFVDDGVKPVFEVTTRLGRRIKVTATHPFLTVSGWKPLAELAVGTPIAVPRRIEAFGSEPMGEHRARILGYLLGDGGMTGNTARFTNSNPTLLDDFTDAVRRFGGVRVTAAASRSSRTTLTLSVVADEASTWEARSRFADPLQRALVVKGQPAHRVAAAVGVTASVMSDWRPGRSAPRPHRVPALEAVLPDVAIPAMAWRNAPNAMRRWLDDLGLMGCGSREKFVPAAVFRVPEQELAVFLNRLFATDGWICTLSTGQVQAGYCSVSERLARQVQHLLLRFGVIASLSLKPVTYRGSRREAWQLDITDAASIESLAEKIGVDGKDRQVQRTIAAARGSSELEALATSDVYWDRITAIRCAGEEQVYDLTVPGTHNFVANDVCVHNSSFAVNVAQSLALYNGKSVALFSLEMSVNELAMRILASDSEVPLRKRRPSDRDWDRIHRAARRTTDARIFIDDSASPTLLEVASKSRRLKLEKGLDLLIIDYLQLMQAGGRYENRNLEIGAITRGLKGLAKELAIPVIALSQLSRQPERRGSDHRPQLADLRESGCLTGDTLVSLADTGARVPLRDLAGRSGFSIWALDQEGLRIKRAEVSSAFCTGTKRVYRLTTRLGRTIRATANHRFLTIDGWQRLDELSAGAPLAMPREVPAPGGNRRRSTDGDVDWDRICSIQEDGVEEVFDLTVPGPHNFIANDLFVHNSIEQDADVVVFIYRDEVYNPENEESQGVAELIVAKNRNGQTGIVDLAFFGETTTFRSLDRHRSS